MRHVHDLAYITLAVLISLPASGGSAPLGLTGGHAASPVAFAPGPMYEETIGRCADTACRADALLALGDEVRAALGSHDAGWKGLPETTRFVLERSGHDARALPVDASPDLAEALVRLYAAIEVPVEVAVITTQAAALDVAYAAALLPLVDAIRVAHVETLAILPSDAREALAADLATTMMLTTFVGSAAGPVPSEWRTLWAQKAAILAAADLDAMGRAAQTVMAAVSAFQGSAPQAASGCTPSLDLPFIRVAGTCDDTYPASALYLLLIDEGGADTYRFGAGAGIFAGAGVGIALDRGDGDDVYDAPSSAQGFGLAGVGVLVDEGGADLYSVTQFGQGMGVAGFGLLHDQGGNDRYLSPALVGMDPIGSKGAGLGGVGILIDDSGDDVYEQAGLDGFVYGAAGGAGWMIERGGSDTYRADEMYIELLGEPLGTFAGPIQVSGEVSGTTVLYEAAGADSYFCGPHVRQGCQGAAGAGSITLLLDEEGSDVYTMGESFSIELVPGLVVFPMGQGSAYGPSAPGGIALLRDLAGDDAYVAEKWAQGYGTVGLAVFSEDAGSDSYSLGAGSIGARGDGAAWVDGAAGVGRDAQ